MALQLVQQHRAHRRDAGAAAKLLAQLAPAAGGLVIIWAVLSVFATLIASVRFAARAALFGWETALAAGWHLFVMPPLTLAVVLALVAVVLVLLRKSR